MDSQFHSPLTPDLDSYRNTPSERLQNAPLSGCDQTSLTTFKSVKRNTYKLTGYPTRPISARSSISLMFTHPQFNDFSTSGKCYLALLSTKATSVCAIDYYKKSLAKPGDTVIIGLSLSSMSIGDKSSPKLQAFLKDFTNYILGYLPIDKPIKIVFEIFKSPTFLKDLMLLYSPSLVILGTARKFSRSTSFEFGQRKFVPLVYAGLEEINRSTPNAHTESSFKFKEDSFKPSNTPGKNVNEVDNGDPKSTTGIQIKIDETPNVKEFHSDIINLFANLNLSPDPKPGAKFMDRRGSMHSVSSSMSSNNGALSGSAVLSESDEDDNDEFADDDYDSYVPTPQAITKKISSTSGNVLLPSGGVEQVRKWKSGSSGSSIGLLSKEERDRLALFEQHQKAISNVNTKKSKSKSVSSQTTKPKKLDSSNSTNSSSTTSTSASTGGGFFKKLLGKK